MSARRKRHSTSFRPTLDREGGALEARWLMAAGGRAGTLPPAFVRQNLVLPHTANNLARGGLPTRAQNYVQTGVGDGGKAAVVVDTDGQVFAVHVTNGGTVRAKAAPGGYVDLFLYGTNTNSIVTIDPEGAPQSKGDAHTFATGTVLQDGMLHVRNITVYDGLVNQILGYRTATLSGAVTVGGNRTGPTFGVTRMAFYSLLPGASIQVAGDLNDLDVYTSAYLNGGPGIQVGRDLNAMNVGTDLILANGASVIAQRDIGLIPQPALGTGPGGQGVLVGSDLVVGPGSTLAPLRYMVGTLGVRGSAVGVQNLPLSVLQRTVVLGTVS